MGQLDNTLIIYLCCDSGPSGEGLVNDTPNEFTTFNGTIDNLTFKLKSGSWNGHSMKNILMLTSIAEVATGLALFLLPVLVGAQLLGEEFTGAAIQMNDFIFLRRS